MGVNNRFPAFAAVIGAYQVAHALRDKRTNSWFGCSQISGRPLCRFLFVRESAA